MKLSEWRLKISETGGNALNKLKGMADGAASRFTALQDKINRGGTAFRDAANEIPGVGRALSIISNPIVLATTAIIALGTALYKAGDYAEHFQTGMAKINATAQLSQPKLDELRGTIIDLGKNSSADLASLPDAFEKILSQVGDVDTSLSIFKTALKGSQAGFADVNVVAGALAQTLSIVGKQNTTAAEVMDTLFAAKRVGAGEFADFATYMPQLIAAGKNLNLSFKDTAGLFAYMTGKGQSAADAAVLMQNAFTALGKSEVQKGMAGAGVKIFDKNGAMRDIKDIIGDMQKRMSGLSDQSKSNLLENMGLRDVQAKNAFSILTSDVGKLNEALSSTRDAVGETNSALEYTKNPATENAIMMNKFKAIFLEIGYVVMPYIHAFFNAIGNAILNIIDGIKEWYKQSTFAQDVVALIGASFQAIWWILQQIGTLLGWLYDHILKPIFDVLGWIYEKIRSAVMAVIEWVQGSETMQKIWLGMKLAVSAIGDALSWIYDHTIQPIVDALSWIYDKISGLFGGGDELKVSVAQNMTTRSEGIKDALKPRETKQKGKNGLNGKLQEGIDSISDGGKSIRNVTVNITKLVESLNVNTTNLKDGAADIKKAVEEYLLRAVQGSEIALSNGG